MSTYNNVIRLLAGSRELPAGWGFPPLARRLPSGLVLRDILMFLRDDDGTAQLCRWYHSMLRAMPSVWRSLAGEEGYDPCMIHQPAVYSPTLDICRSPVTGTMLLGWYPGPGDSPGTATGRLSLGEVSQLTMGDQTWEIRTTEHADSGILSVNWPEFLGCAAGIRNSPGGSIHTVYFRPVGFYVKGLVDAILERGVDELDRAGLLDEFLSIPRFTEKLAIAWLAVARLEEQAS